MSLSEIRRLNEETDRDIHLCIKVYKATGYDYDRSKHLLLTYTEHLVIKPPEDENYRATVTTLVAAMVASPEQNPQNFAEQSPEFYANHAKRMVQHARILADEIFRESNRP